MATTRATASEMRLACQAFMRSTPKRTNKVSRGSAAKIAEMATEWAIGFVITVNWSNKEITFPPLDHRFRCTLGGSGWRTEVFGPGLRCGVRSARPAVGGLRRTAQFATSGPVRGRQQ